MLYTKKQREIIEFVSGFQKTNGYSPTLEEIAKAGVDDVQIDWKLDASHIPSDPFSGY